MSQHGCESHFQEVDGPCGQCAGCLASKQSQHTPTPWEAVPAEGWLAEPGAWDSIGPLHGSSQIEVDCIFCSEDDAAFIVKACNSHDALVKALESAKAALNPENGYLPMSQRVVAHEEARAALALAKEA